MNSSRQETIADIVAEMLEFADAESQSIGRDVLRRRIQHFQDALRRRRSANAKPARLRLRSAARLARWLGEKQLAKKAR